MNIRQVEIFKAVFESGTVTQAAKNLGLAQPSVSKHLKLLEYGLGLTLFQRSGNRLTATAEGLALFDQVERVYTGLGFLETFADGLRNNQHGELSIAAMPLISQKWLPKCIAGFIATHQKVSFSLPVRSSSWIATAVAAKRVHFGIGLKPVAPVPGIRVTPLMQLPFVCVLPPDHPLTKHPFVELDMIRGHGLITLRNFEGQSLVFETMARDFQSGESRTIETFSASVACELARQGAGVALVDAMTARDTQGGTLEIRPFRPQTIMDICIMTSEHWPLSQIAHHVMDMMLDQARDTERALAEANLYR